MKYDVLADKVTGRLVYMREAGTVPFSDRERAEFRVIDGKAISDDKARDLYRGAAKFNAAGSVVADPDFVPED
jgi:hypothetical protein